MIHEIIPSIMPIILVTKPAAAIPFGDLFFCFTEKTIPKIPIRKAIKGIIMLVKILKIPKIKLAIPRLLLISFLFMFGFAFVFFLTIIKLKKMRFINLLIH